MKIIKVQQYKYTGTKSYPKIPRNKKIVVVKNAKVLPDENRSII